MVGKELNKSLYYRNYILHILSKKTQINYFNNSSSSKFCESSVSVWIEKTSPQAPTAVATSTETLMTVAATPLQPPTATTNSEPDPCSIALPISKPIDFSKKTFQRFILYSDETEVVKQL